MQQLSIKDLLIIGAGPAGLKAAEQAEDLNLDYLILESGKIGQAWRNVRPDMRLLSPCHPQRDWTSLSYKFPIWKRDVDRPYCTASDFVEYLEAFADHFKLNIRTGIQVNSVTFDDGQFYLVTESDERFIAKNVLVASGVFGNPYLPDIPGIKNNPAVVHSHDYSGSAEYEKQRVLIIGAGNSAAEIATDLAGKAMVYLVHRGELEFFSDTKKLQDIRGISESYLRELIQMEIIRYYSYQNLIEIKGNRAFFKDRVLEVDKVIFATGYRPSLRMLDTLELRFGKNNSPEVTMVGQSIQYPGLFFAGPLIYPSPSGVVIHTFVKQLEKTVQRISERIKTQSQTEDSIQQHVSNNM